MPHDFTRPIDLNSLPASLLIANAQDPAKAIPGSPPLFGQEIIPHFMTSTGYVGSAARAYPIEDEATRNSVENAERMRTETGIMEPLEARMRASALLKYHLVPEDEKSPKQIKLAQTLTRILERTPRFVEYRRTLMEALWFGKYANVNTFGTTQVGGKWRTVIKDWSPRHGDKLMFRYSDGTHKYAAGQLGIRVHSSFFANAPRRFAEMNEQQRRMKVEATQYGLVYWFDDYERETIVVHKHMVEDGPWHEPMMMGRVMGVGIRDRIYWTWYAMQSLLQDLLTYINRAALGVRLWRYPSGNKAWKEAVENAAKNAIANGVADILFPVEPNEYASLYGVEQIEPGISGAQMIRELIEGFFLRKIKKYILGQLLTSEADGGGMGSGVAEAHLSTFSDIVLYDASNLQETITEQLIKKLQKENAPKSLGVHVRFVLDTDAPDVQKRLAAIQAAYQMDIPIKVEDVYMLTGLSKPEPQDDVVTVSRQQLRQQRAQMELQEEAQERQARFQLQIQAEQMQQQAAMQQQMGAQGGQPGAEGGEGGSPEEEAALQQAMAQAQGGPEEKASMLDVSPQTTDRDNGPAVPASGEIDKMAADEPAAQQITQSQNPWNGFWESFFNAARGGQPPGETQEVQEAPEQGLQETPEPRQGLLSRMIGDMLEQYGSHSLNVQDFTEDLDKAMRRIMLAKGFDAAIDRQMMIERFEDALDHEMLVDQLTKLLNQRVNGYDLPEIISDEMDKQMLAIQIGNEMDRQMKLSPEDEFCQAFMKNMGYDGAYSLDATGAEDTPDRYPEHDEYAVQQTLFKGASPDSTPKQFHWEPPTDIDPAKRPAHPDQNINLQQKQQWANRWNIRNMFRDHLKDNNDLIDSEKSSVLGHAQKALSLIPHGAINRLSSSLKGVNFYPTHDAVTARSADLNTIHRITTGKIEPKLYPRSRSQASGSMFYDAATGHMHAPLFETMPFDPVSSKHLGGNIQPHQGYMHELAHAIDKGGANPPIDATDEDFYHDFLSSSNEWKSAWAEELSEYQLNTYSATSEEEGFAEFARLAWTRPKAARKLFPQCYEFFAKHDLVHPRPIQAVPPKRLRKSQLEKRHVQSSPGQLSLFSAKRD